MQPTVLQIFTIACFQPIQQQLLSLLTKNNQSEHSFLLPDGVAHYPLFSFVILWNAREKAHAVEREKCTHCFCYCISRTLDFKKFFIYLDHLLNMS